MTRTAGTEFLRLVVDREKEAPKIKGLYLITDHGDRLVERVQSALTGGVSVLQFRWKKGNDEERLSLGMELKRLCAEAGVPFIVNDNMDLARQLDADGVHLGQDDGDPASARRLLGPGKIIGVSTHDLQEAMRAEAAGADYIGFGAMYPTASKQVINLPGPVALDELRTRITIPIVAIGGINRDNAVDLIDRGADAVAVISSVLDHREPDLAASELALLFNRRLAAPRGAVLTVAGSDSGGGAGIQADLKTVTLLGSYCASVITALTAQNTRGVSAVHPAPVSFVEEQLRAVLSDIPIDVVKTGMLFSDQIVSATAQLLQEFGRRMLIVDPVMTAKGGTALMGPDGVAPLRDTLLPLTYLVTPNIPEAEKLTGMTISDEESMREAARMIHKMGARNVLLKGGHLPGGEAVDILYDGKAFLRFPGPRILTKNTHGTGCTLASAIAAFLAGGEPLPKAVGRAKDFVTAAIRLARPLGRGHGPVNHFLAAQENR